MELPLEEAVFPGRREVCPCEPLLGAFIAMARRGSQYGGNISRTTIAAYASSSGGRTFNINKLP
jgi:hypothetical protein